MPISTAMPIFVEYVELPLPGTVQKWIGPFWTYLLF